MICPCAVVPTFDNPATVRQVVVGLREHVSTVFVVDDGSAPPGAEAVAELAVNGLARVIRLEQNQGKGAACMAGFRAARDAGFTHAVQVDADNQHTLDDVPRFLAEAGARPEALVCGVPQFGADAPRSRVIARKISVFWVAVELGIGVVRDPLCGFRIYPLQAALAVPLRAPRMAFDTDIAVRMVMAGAEVSNLPTAVRYPTAEEGAVSHFRPLQDSWALSLLHTRLFFASLAWRIRRLGGAR